jgi:hypothetical protein
LIAVGYDDDDNDDDDDDKEDNEENTVDRYWGYVWNNYNRPVGRWWWIDRVDYDVGW